MPVRHLFLCAVVLIGCRAAAPHASAAAAEPVKKVLIIGVDGLRPDKMRDARTPRIDFLIAAGSVSYTATNCWTPDKAYNGHSAPNWASLLTGVTPDEHGIERNGDATHRIDDDDANPGPGTDVKTIFGYAKAHDPHIQTAVFNTWDGIGMGRGSILEFSRHAVDDQYCAPAPPEPSTRDVLNTRAAVHAIRGEAGGRFAVAEGDFDVPGYPDADPDLIFVHLSQVDHAGHTHTWSSPQYLAAIENVDALIGKLIDAIHARPHYADEDWLILLTADHGGPENGYGHGDTGDPQVRTIPLIVSGRSALKGANLAGASLYDVTPTVLRHLGVDVESLKLRGKPVGLAAPPPAAPASRRPSRGDPRGAG